MCIRDRYNKARKRALKENPLLAALEFKACPKCRKCMTCTEEIRHDRGGATRYRWICLPCKNAQIGAITRSRKTGSAELTEKGKLTVEQRGMTKAEKARAKLERDRAKQVALKGWSKNVLLKYGLTLEQYVEMLERQDYTCAMSGCSFKHRHEEWCALPPRRVGKKAEYHHGEYLLVVDHCHATGQVRALLCAQCNLILGNVEKALRQGLSIWSVYNYQQQHLVRIRNAEAAAAGSVHNVVDARAEHGRSANSGAAADPELLGDRSQAPGDRCLPRLREKHVGQYVLAVEAVPQPGREGSDRECVDVSIGGNVGVAAADDREGAVAAAHAA